MTLWWSHTSGSQATLAGNITHPMVLEALGEPTTRSKWHFNSSPDSYVTDVYLERCVEGSQTTKIRLARVISDKLGQVGQF